MAERTKKKRKLAWRIFDAVITCVLLAILIILLVNVILSATNPNYVPNFFGRQLYTIVTDSMEPTIPVGSLMSAKALDADDRAGYSRAAEIAQMDISNEEKSDIMRKEGVEELPFGTIVVFRAYSAEMGKEIIVTHYFDRIVDGRALTYAEQFERGDKVNGERIDVKSRDQIVRYDGYDNKTVDDIIAVYDWHLAGVGNFMLFLKSPMALVMYGVIAIIIVVGIFAIKRINRKKKDNGDGDNNDSPNGDNSGGVIDYDSVEVIEFNDNDVKSLNEPIDKVELEFVPPLTLNEPPSNASTQTDSAENTDPIDIKNV